MDEKYVVSLETAKRMKELGFPQETDFIWVDLQKDDHWYLLPNSEDVTLKAKEWKMNLVAAPHVGELGDFIPKRFRLPVHNTIDGRWMIGESSEDLQINIDTEADARAKMLIYLAENKLIDPKTLK